MNFTTQIKMLAQQSIQNLYGIQVPMEEIAINDTKPEFEGEFTLVTFGLTKVVRKKPEEIGEELGQEMLKSKIISSYNVIKGFLNLSLISQLFTDYLSKNHKNSSLGQHAPNSKKIMVEFSSPNTNKPLHFGHLRNIFLGDAMARIAKACGYEVCRANLINDRGIHICKSMIAWQLFGHGDTPESTQMKGDHFVGHYYVLFNNVYVEEMNTLIADGMGKDEAKKKAPIFIKAQEMLLKWEEGDTEVRTLWERMNNWVYQGFDISYARLGIQFDRVYHESETYLLGKKEIDEGLEKGVFYPKEDGSIWINLEADGLDEKLVLRADGTSVYITQDIGTAQLKYEEEHMDKSVYVIADEQNYHMKVLKLILEKLGKVYANGIFHLSYGMVELPDGKMKSREGTVVDADDMIDEMIAIAKTNTEELGKVDDFSEAELVELYNTIGLGALKFYLLRVDPKKRMIFDPKESIDFHGFTGPFVQYTHARLSSILRKGGELNAQETSHLTLKMEEKDIIHQIEKFEQVVMQATTDYNPSLICNYCFNLAKSMNGFLANHKILNAESEDIKQIRLQIAQATKIVLANGLELLGIKAPERM